MQKQSTNRESTNQPKANAPKIFKLLLLFALLLLFQSCNGNKSGGNSSANMTPTASPAATPVPQAKFSIDADRAFENVRKQVEIGPRPAGSAELAKARDFIVGELKSYGLNVTQDEFTPKTPIGERKMVNIIAELPGESSDVIIISSHYDTKLYKEFRFVGANDGGSSTGTLMEMARVMAASGQKRPFTYWFVFFDGEEAFCKDWSKADGPEGCENPDGPDNTYGSRHMVKQLSDKGDLKRIRAMILLDMMGSKDLELGRDDMSIPWLIDEVWQTARELGYDKYFLDRKEGVGGDDHEPFLKAGVASLDIIQLSTYDAWHTPDDTLDKISPQSLKIVGDVVLNSLPKIEQHLLSTRGPS
jgi:Zn-dependent M28 family amino/carboxypeptidase